MLVLNEGIDNDEKTISNGGDCNSRVCSDTGRQDSNGRVQLKVEHADVPLYPEPARTANIFGTVEVQVTVKDGAVVNAEVKSGPPLLTRSTVENIQSWRFALHANDTFTTKFIYQVADDGDPANPRVELQLPYQVRITGVRVRLDTGSNAPPRTATH
jgi:hypothetical protein